MILAWKSGPRSSPTCQLENSSRSGAHAVRALGRPAAGDQLRQYGMPYGRPGGAWALLRNGQVELRHAKIDIDAAVEHVVRESRYPGRREWAEEHTRSANSDADALAAFAPRDGRR